MSDRRITELEQDFTLEQILIMLEGCVGGPAGVLDEGFPAGHIDHIREKIHAMDNEERGLAALLFARPELLDGLEDRLRDFVRRQIENTEDGTEEQT